jgi:hypothetical protein
VVAEENGTAKYAKGAKECADIVFKEESYKIIGACFDVTRKKEMVF